MPVVTPDKLVALQRQTDAVRNICILAHVDHGKTSLSDALIATNGIISPKLAGKIRYLDSRPDEQLRGITMESSAISLYFSMSRRASPESPPEQKEYLINLIDSPGHIDFSSEVSTASRLCDGALVLVDAVEGVQSQTVTVLRHTWTEHLKPLLVINKVDRLIAELKLSAVEAYAHLSRLLEQVNAVIGSFYQGERMEEDLQWREKMEKKAAAAAERRAAQAENAELVAPSTTTGDYEEKDDEDLYFSPEKNNVIFSSAVDGWAFTTRQFAALYEKKLGIKRAVLEKVLWGDFYLDPKTKRILGSKHLKGRPLKPMFVQLVLDSIWSVYNATMGGSNAKGDPALLEKITSSLSIKIPPHVSRSRDPHAIMSNVFNAWLPLSTAVLVSTVEYLSSPSASQSSRFPLLLDSSPGSSFIGSEVRHAIIEAASSTTVPKVVYVSKMIAVRESELPKISTKKDGPMTGMEARDLARKKRAELQKANASLNDSADAFSTDEISDSLPTAREAAEYATAPEEEDDPEHLIGFARTYSGTLSVGDEIYVLAPKFTPAQPDAEPKPTKVTISGLYLLMGRGLEALSSVPPGVVCGIAGLESHVLKSATLCSQTSGAPNLAGVSMGNQPIVRVALEPQNPSDLDKMVHGMKLLEQSDPCARYELMPSGEHVILTAGELHLERCLKDLRERFAKCEIQAGEPIVPYRETIINDSEMALQKNKDLPRGTVISTLSNQHVTIRFRTLPLPKIVTEYLLKYADAMRQLNADRSPRNATNEQNVDGEQNTVEDDVTNTDADGDEPSSGLLSVLEFREGLRDVFNNAKDHTIDWTKIVDQITAFGPRRSGSNILIDATPEEACDRILEEDATAEPPKTESQENGEQNHGIRPHDLTDKINYAFQLATAQGPMCHEPMQGVCVILESINIQASETSSSTADTNNSSTNTNLKDTLGRLTGEVLKTTTSAIHAGFLDWSPRLMLAYYSCTIQTHPTVLGRTYSTLSRLHAIISSESMDEGTPFYSIVALLPMTTSFNIASELLKSTSGAAQPQLLFHGFEILDEDPFWVPRSEEELEDFGEKGDRERWSKMLMEGVRRRKGLHIRGERIVKEGEKQKTLKR